MSEFEVVPLEANCWWRKNAPAGAILNRLMLLFIVVPIALVTQRLYTLSFVVFAFMIPYGFLVRHLAVRAVRSHIASHPEVVEEFEAQGIISG
jgi:hypothetical protein